jgi:hypothetical protein
MENEAKNIGVATEQNRDLRSKSDCSGLLERLRAARDVAYAESDNYKMTGDEKAAARRFGEGVGIEKAVMLIFGHAL